MSGAFRFRPNVDLSWEPGFGGVAQTVYFDEDYDAVNNGTIDGVLVGEAAYDPGPLEYDTTYYWRVETAGPTYGQFKGDVWSFKTVAPYAGIKAEYYNWTSAAIPPSRSAAFSTLVLTRIESEINHHLGEGSPDPLVNVDQFAGRWSAELDVAFSEPHTFWTLTDDGVRVWLDGELIIDDWNDHGPTWNPSQPIDLVAGQRYALVMEYFENVGGATVELDWESPSMPRQVIPAGPLQLPLRASIPDPFNGATDVKETPTLTWKAGEQAASHQVYFGTDEDAVRNATTASPEYIDTRVLGNESYEPGKLAWSTTYYWRIDEVNNLHPDSPWKGNIWSFTTGDFLVVDDFEDYNTTDKQIWAIWHDGIGYFDLDMVYHPGNNTGSGVGDEDNEDSYMEETIVNNGNMSMPYFFNNNDPAKMKYSEAKKTLIKTRDWTEEGVKALSLWFQGIPASVGSFIDNLDGTYTMTASGTDIWAEADEFHFAYKPLSGAGSIIARVDSVDNTNEWAKAGVMIRESLDPNSVHAFMCVTPGQGVALQHRITTGGESAQNQVTDITAPQWVKIERDFGGIFTASYSDDGQNWTVVDATEQIFMGSDLFIGLALTAHNASATCQAEFSNVQVSVSGSWSNQDIGILSNEPERMYVAVSNSNGTTGTVYYEDN
ncbi:MAG: PA14 domain-containing protein, partial [Planctomycetota bacterium]